MARSMAFVTRGTIPVEHIMSAMSEMSDGSDRAVAIVGGSLIETALTDAIIVHLHRNKKLTDRMFSQSGPFGAFGTKINLALLIGLIGVLAHKELTTIKDIRNTFAHDLGVTDFKSPKIMNWTKNLILCERYAVDSKQLRQSIKGKIDFATTPHRDWPHWVIINDLDAALKDPREKFLVTMQIFMWGFSIPDRTAMPSAIFY